MQQQLPKQLTIPFATSEEVNPEDIFNTISWDKILEDDEEEENEE